MSMASTISKENKVRGNSLPRCRTFSKTVVLPPALPAVCQAWCWPGTDIAAGVGTGERRQTSSRTSRDSWFWAEAQKRFRGAGPLLVCGQSDPRHPVIHRH